jgi:hypothetical protein
MLLSKLSNVAVKVLGVTPGQAQDTWLSFQWERGSGLPVLVSQKKDEQTHRLFPIGMEETLIEK